MQPNPNNAGDYEWPVSTTYPVTGETLLRSYDMRTAPDRLQAYCDALERRVAELERSGGNWPRIVQLEMVLVALEARVRRLENAEAQE